MIETREHKTFFERYNKGKKVKTGRTHNISKFIEKNAWRALRCCFAARSAENKNNETFFSEDTTKK